MRGPGPVGTIAALALLASGCGGSSGTESGATAASPVEWVYQVPEAVADGWETATLGSVGLDPRPLERLMTELQARPGHRVHAVLVVRHGRLVFEEYFPGLSHPTFGEQPTVFDRETRHCLSSVTKSVAATLLGVAVEQGAIDGVQQGVFDLFPHLMDLNVGARGDLTLEHLVTMSAGLEWDEQSRSLRDPLNDLTAWLALARDTAEDPVRAVLARPMVAAPGTVFNYSGGLTNVLGQAIQNATGQRLDDFSRRALFTPLGIEEAWWWILREDFVYASGDIALRPRDLARLGLLYLGGGTWNGQRVLSPSWVEASATPRPGFPGSDYAASGAAGYGYGWWVLGREYGAGAYAAWGWGGQKLIVLPEHDMVVVFTGGSYWDAPLLSPHQMMTGYVLPAIVG